MANRNTKNNELTDEKKAATIVVALGAEKASKVYKYLDSDEVEKLTYEIARLGHVTSEDTEEVLDEFYKTALTQKVVTEGGMEYAKEVLEKAYGKSTADELLGKITKYLKNRPFDFIQDSDGKSLFSVLQHERAQIIALVLSYVDTDLAAEVIKELPEHKRIQVVENIATMDRASPSAIKIVEQELKKKFEKVFTADFTEIGGIDYVADVMNQMDRGNERFIFEEMNKTNPTLAESIRKKMFVFEDILGLDNRAAQIFIRECDIKDIVYGLKNASDEMKSLFFSNMSSRMAESVKSDLEITVNVRLKDVEEAQQRIVGVIRRLDEEGKIIISKGGKDDIIA